jgi:uridine kinase
MMPNLQPVVDAILRARGLAPAERSLLAAISGIDGSGKGYVSERLAAALRARGLGVAVINADGWLRLPHERFSEANPGEHFYRHAIRFDELFGELVLPLRDQRSCRVTMDFVEETATRTRRHTVEFDDVDVIILEGIFLLKRELRAHYDLSIWVDCSFATALQRAIARGQEGLNAEATARAYRRIYFAAQEIHFSRDGPRMAATLIIGNDRANRPAGAPQPVELQPC